MTYVGLRPVPLAVEREVLASYFSLREPAQPAIATSEGYRRGVAMLQSLAGRNLLDQRVRAQLIRRGLL